jgi:hypothetical protein
MWITIPIFKDVKDVQQVIHIHSQVTSHILSSWLTLPRHGIWSAEAFRVPMPGSPFSVNGAIILWQFWWENDNLHGRGSGFGQSQSGWFPMISIFCKGVHHLSTSALFWPRAIYKLPAWLFFFLRIFESYNPNVTLGTCTSASWAGSFFVVESFSPGWTDCLRHALWPWCGPQALVEISANGPLGVSMRYFILWHI